MLKIIHNSRKKTRTLFLVLFLLFNFLAFIPSHKPKAGLVEWILCQDEIGAKILELGTTDKLHYLLRSKSSVTPLHDVDGGLNGLLKIGGYDFKANNERLLGRPLIPTGIKDEIKSPNEGPKISVWDRFGMAGTSWSAYLGEWKYYSVDVCNPKASTTTSYNQYYTNRVEPKSTWSQIFSSKDPRSIQMLSGDAQSNAFVTTFANLIFSISKFMVTITITLVGLSFSDIPKAIGISSQLTSGIFNSLWNSIYIPLLGFSIVITGLRFLWIAGAKRQFREGIQGLLKVILIFLLGIVIHSNPSVYINLPNNIATTVQSLLINAISTESGGSGSLCGTNIGDLKDKSDLDKASENMRSQIGCLLWEKLVYTTWVRGQFGVEPGQADKLDIKNEAFVGKPLVPLGGGSEIESWSVFTLSTHTNAHSQLGESNVNTKVDDTNVDWWRTVDALSNYTEKETVENINGENVSKIEQEIHAVHPYWNHFVGNRSSERVGLAIYNIFLSGFAVTPILIFSFLSVIYGVLLILAMVFAPIMFLFGLWSGKGEQIFLGWVQSIGTLFLKKVGVTLLMLFSFSVINVTLDLMNSIGWVKALLLMIILAVLLIQHRDTILDKLSKVNFGGTWNPMTGIKRSFDNNTRRVKSVSNIGIGAVAGGYAAVRTGQSIREGMAVATKATLKNEFYKTSWGTHAAVTSNTLGKGVENLRERICTVCGTKLSSGSIGFIDSIGSVYCQRCGEESDRKDLQEIKLTKPKEMKTRSIKSTKNLSYLSHSYSARLTEFKMTENGGVDWNATSAIEMIRKNLTGLSVDIEVHKSTSKFLGESALTPKIPEAIEEYLDTASINVAWEQGHYEFIEQSYKNGWKQYFADNHRVTDTYSSDKERGERLVALASKYIDNHKATPKEEVLDNLVAEIIIDFAEGKDFKQKEDSENPSFIYDEGVVEVNTFVEESFEAFEEDQSDEEINPGYYEEESE